MKIKDLLKRIYYALASGAFFVILLNSWTRAFAPEYSRYFYHLNIGVCGVVLTCAVAAYCWAMSRDNGKSVWKWWAGAIPVILMIVRFGLTKMLTAMAFHNDEFIDIYAVDIAYFGVLAFYPMVITFCSNRKWDYRNMLPGQTRLDTFLLRWVPVVAHVVMWFWFSRILYTFYVDWLSWWPTEAWLNDAVNQANDVFEGLKN